MIIINRFGKRPFLIPCYKDIDAKKTARLYIHYIYRIYKPLNIIISDCGLQFISAF